MSLESLARELEDGLAQVPLFDVHTHLVGGRLGARGLHDILLYHMVISDLRAAGCPSGARLTQYPGWPTREEAHARLREALPYVPQIVNTSCFWGVRLILRDLYGWSEPVTLDNWGRLDDLIRERADDQAWHHDVWDRLLIHQTGTEIARRADGSDDARFQYALEWGFFTRCQWGEYDTALYELERCWGKTPQSPMPIGGDTRPSTERTIRSLDDVHAAIAHYVSAIPYDQVAAMATHISTDLNLRPVSDDQMAAALQRRDQAGPVERDAYAGYINEAFLTALEGCGRPLVFQFSLGAEPLPYETASRLTQETLAQVAEMIARHPALQFMCFCSSRHANQSLCTIARELGNLSLPGYWWHNFFPDVMRQVMAERLDMLPMNRQIGFFSDAYCIEWVYAKVLMVRKQLAWVLAQKVLQGQYDVSEALGIARGTLFESPQALLGMKPRMGEGL